MKRSNQRIIAFLVAGVFLLTQASLSIYADETSGHPSGGGTEITLLDALTADVLEQTVPVRTARGQLQLPAYLTGTGRQGTWTGSVRIPIAAWASEPFYIPQMAGTYTMRPIPAAHISLAADVRLPEITVTVEASSISLFRFVGGIGTAFDPLVIDNSRSFYELAQEWNSGALKARNLGHSGQIHIALTEDLDLSYGAMGAYWEPLGNNANPFDGVLNGGGSSVFNLGFSTSNGTVQGLFGEIDGDGEARNFAVSGAVTGSDTLGLVVGINRGLIEQVSATGRVTGDTLVGGIAGQNFGIIREVSADIAVSSTGGGRAGGVAGFNGGTILNSRVLGSVTGSGDYLGGIAGDNDGSVEQCFTVAQVHTDGDGAGGIAGRNQAGGSLVRTVALGYSVQASGTAGAIAGGGDADGSNYHWDRARAGASDNISDVGTGQTSSQLAQVAGWPAGFAADPWQFTDGKLPVLTGVPGAQDDNLPAWLTSDLFIRTADELVSFAEGFNNGSIESGYNGTVYLLGDIDLGTVSHRLPTGWHPIGASTPFKGNFDGGNHTITGLRITKGSSNLGLFGTVTGGSIRNLTIVCDIDVDAQYVGAFAGQITNGVIESCTVEGSVKSNKHYLGGIAGRSIGSTIAHSQNRATVIGTVDYVGGIAGHSTDQIQDCVNRGNVSGRGYVGGITGSNASNAGAGISNCTNHGDVYANDTSLDDYSYVGGIAGNSNGAIADSINRGAVTGEKMFAGGIAGYTSGSNARISRCINSGAVKSQMSRVGGIAGHAARPAGAVIEQCVNSGSVRGDGVDTDFVGGIAGQAKTVANCVNTGAVTGGGQYAGGIVGQTDDRTAFANTGNLVNCINLGDVHAADFAGGIAGGNSLELYTIENCWSLGQRVTATVNAGAVAGEKQFAGESYYHAGLGFGATPSTNTNTNGTEMEATVRYGTADTWPDAFKADPWVYVPGRMPVLAGMPAAQDDVIPNWLLNQADEVRIFTAKDLADLAAAVNGGNAHSGVAVRLMNNIDLTEVCNAAGGWTPIGAESNRFSGTFLGDGHVISGLRVAGNTSDYQGLFGYIDMDGSVSDLAVDGQVTGKDYVGILAGYSKGDIKNCFVLGNASGANYVGGVAGSVDGAATNCISAASVTGNSYVGGLAGEATSNASLTDSVAVGAEVTGIGNAGPIQGTGQVSTSNLYWDGMTVSGSSSKLGTAKSGAELARAGTWSGTAFASTPWSYQAGDLPRLSGQTSWFPLWITVFPTQNGADVLALNLVSGALTADEPPAGSSRLSATIGVSSSVTHQNELEWDLDGFTPGSDFVDNGDGTYTITFPQNPGGSYTIEAWLKKDNTKRDSITFAVTPRLRGMLTISGTPVQGSMLSASTAGVSYVDRSGSQSPSGTGYAYNWYYSDDLATSVGTGATYTLAGADVGKSLTVKATHGDHPGEVVSASTAPVSTTAIGLSGISISPVELTLEEGTTGQLAVVYNPANTTISRDESWSSNNAAVATVNTATGFVTAVGPGTATITVTVGGKTATRTVTVTRTLQSVTVNGSSTMNVGDRAVFTYSTNPTGATITGSAVWTSSNPSAATVDRDTGEVRAVAPGSVIITVSVDGKAGIKPIVVNAPLTGTGGISGPSSMVVGDRDQLTVALLPANTTDTLDYAWSSSNPGTVTVDPLTGAVEAVGTGTATITVVITVNGGPSSHTEQHTIAVSPQIPVTGIAIPDTVTLVIGGEASKVIPVTYTPANTTERGVSWHSDNPAAATVDASTGRVTAVAPGTATITATGAHGLADTCQVRVIRGVQEVHVQGAGTLQVGDERVFTYTVEPSDATAVGTVRWTSSDPSVATVDSGTGRVTAVGPGTAVITATVDGKSGSLTVSVAGASGITVQGPSALTVGDQASFTATFYPGNPNGWTVTWASSDPSVATVRDDGIVTAVGPGTATITATGGGLQGSIAVTVSVGGGWLPGQVPQAMVPGHVSSGSSSSSGGGSSSGSSERDTDAAKTKRSGDRVTWASGNGGTGITLNGVATTTAFVKATVSDKNGPVSVDASNLIFGENGEVTLKQSWLDTLTPGEYTLRLEYMDSLVEIPLTILPSQGGAADAFAPVDEDSILDTLPNTGRKVLLWAVLGAALLAAGFVLHNRKRD